MVSNFQLKYSNLTIDPPQAVINSIIHLLINIDCQFGIYINNQLFFDENINILEFIYSFEKWAKDKKCDFFYSSSDEEEENMLTFKKIGAHYYIESIHQKFNFIYPIKITKFEYELTRLREELFHELKSKYAISALEYW